MPRDSEATRARVIEAGLSEFAAHGLAGARVDRIAASAAANKRAIYDYFGNKEGLFDATLDRVVSNLIASVPLDEHDLPGYAATLFDYLLDHPDAVRMISWRRLERPQAAPHLADTFVAHMTAIRDRPGAGADTDAGAQAIDPVDLVILVIGLANAWQLSSAELLAAEGGDPHDPQRIAAHRNAVIEAARRLSATV